MRSAHRIGIAVVTAALAAGPGMGRAGAPPKRGADPPVDERLLEFLGSVDPSTASSQPDDGGWLEFLSQVNIGKAAKPAQAPQAPQAPPKLPKPSSPTAGTGKPGE
jgi:hypothetical protein